MHCFRFVLVLVAFVFTACDAVRAADDIKKPTAKQPKFELRDGDRVVFLGNTLIERAQKYGYWETMLTARYPNKNITFRNLGWSGDTVWAESRGMFDPPAVGYKRMIEHVGRLKPTVIFVGYGNNEAFAGQERLPAFLTQYLKLLDDLVGASAKGVRFVLLSPMLHESIAPNFLDVKTINANIEKYAAVVEDVANARECHFLDLLKLQKRWDEVDANLTYDGLHLDGAGYHKFTYLVRAGMGYAKSKRSEADTERLTQLRQTIIAKNRLYFYSWRPQNITYLTGFRKHEQGQNAKELAEFDKLIVAKEKEINKLKKPVAHTYEIIRVKKDK
jgi:lysophospholipase L1-like esterase